MTRQEARLVRRRLERRLLPEPTAHVPWINENGEDDNEVAFSVLDGERLAPLLAELAAEGWECATETEAENVFVTVTNWPETLP